jgi:hypothetical protein
MKHVTEEPETEFATMRAEALAILERQVRQALDRTDLGELKVLGYGDSSVVLACEVDGQRFACKRLPVFPSRANLSHYSDLLERYIAELRLRGVSTIETHLQPVTIEESGCVAYCIQPAIDESSLLHRHLAKCPHSEAEQLLDRLLEIVLSVVSDRVGFDADVSNWCLQNSQLTLIDVTTPLLRDENMNQELPVDMFLASLPWIVRGVLRQIGVDALVGKFHTPRGILLDMLCGLYREGIEQHVPYFMARANEVADPSFSLRELRRYGLLNETIWNGKRKLQQLERLWRVRVLGKTYPFLLPPKGAFAGRLKAVPQL